MFLFVVYHVPYFSCKILPTRTHQQKYNIGFKEGISLGAGLMWERLWDMGRPRKRNPRIRAVELQRDDNGSI